MLAVTLNNGTMFSTSAATLNNFIGFTTSAPILSLTFVPTTSGLHATANDLIVGQASSAHGVPDAGSTMLLLGAALVGLAVCWRVLRAGPFAL